MHKVMALIHFRTSPRVNKKISKSRNPLFALTNESQDLQFLKKTNITLSPSFTTVQLPRLKPLKSLTHPVGIYRSAKSTNSVNQYCLDQY